MISDGLPLGGDDDDLGWWPDSEVDTTRDEPDDVLPGAGAVRRALRLRMAAALAIVHAVGDNADGISVAFEQISSDEFPDMFSELLDLLATYLPRDAAESIRGEVLGFCMALEDDGGD